MNNLNLHSHWNPEKVNELLAEAKRIRNTNALKGLELSKEAIKIADSIKYVKGLAKANFSAGVCCRLTSQFDASINYFNESIKIYRLTEDRKGQSRVLNSIANVHISLGNYDIAIEHFEECIFLVQSIGDIAYEGIALANIALAYQQQGNLVSSLENFLQSLSIYKSLNRPIPHTLLNNIGIVYLEIGNYFVALKYFNDALKTEEETGNLLDESFTLANIGRTYIFMDDCSNAVTYLSESLALTKKNGNRQSESQIFSNLGKAYVKLRCYPEAISYFNKALSYYKEISDKCSVSHTLSEMGDLYFQLNDFAVSRKYFYEGLSVAEENNDEVNEVRNCSGLAGLYIKFMDIDSANKYLGKAALLAERRKSFKELSSIYKLLSEGYLSIGNSIESNRYLQLHYENLKKLIQIEEEQSLKVFTASHKFHTANKKIALNRQKNDENVTNQDSSKLLKNSAN